MPKATKGEAELEKASFHSLSWRMVSAGKFAMTASASPAPLANPGQLTFSWHL
jgi:hypothetical protein